MARMFEESENLLSLCDIMKKMIALLMLFMYSLSVSGSVVQLHFCGNDFKSFSVNKVATKSCCCPVKKNEGKAQKELSVKKSCCSQKDVALKIQVDQASNNNIFQLQVLQTGLLPVAAITPVFEQALTLDFAVTVYPANAPPDGNWQGIPLYKLFQRLTYYG